MSKPYKTVSQLRDDLIVCIRYAETNEEYIELVGRICRLYENGALGHKDMMEIAKFLIICHTNFIIEWGLSPECYLKNEETIGEEMEKSKCLEFEDIDFSKSVFLKRNRK